MMEFSLSSIWHSCCVIRTANILILSINKAWPPQGSFPMIRELTLRSSALHCWLRICFPCFVTSWLRGILVKLDFFDHKGQPGLGMIIMALQISKSIEVNFNLNILFFYFTKPKLLFFREIELAWSRSLVG